MACIHTYGMHTYLPYATSLQRQHGEDDTQDRMRHVTNLAIQIYDTATLSKGGGDVREGGGGGGGGGGIPRRQGGAGVGDGGAGGGVLQPVTRLRDELIRALGADEGERAHQRLERSARNSILQALYALRHKLQVGVFLVWGGVFLVRVSWF